MDKKHVTDIAIQDTGPLTPREAEALLWVARGKTSWEIGQIIGCTEATVNAHILSAGQKLSASTRPHMVAVAFINGIIGQSARIILVLLLSASLLSPINDAIMRVARRPVRRREHEPTQLT